MLDRPITNRLHPRGKLSRFGTAHIFTTDRTMLQKNLKSTLFYYGLI